MLFLGVDLAWAEGSQEKLANQSGVVVMNGDGKIIDATWTVGIDETQRWIVETAANDALLLVDAPLVVNNDVGTQRSCEREISQRYMHPWGVGANSTHPGSARLGGVRLLQLLEEAGWRYSDGISGPKRGGQWVSECYPYTTIVGAVELSYDKRPLYKRRPRRMRVAEWRPLRATECDELIGRIAGLAHKDPRMDLMSHPTTRELVEEPSPLDDRAYKRREDLLDAALCAWTASLWARWGEKRCQVLGAASGPSARQATIIAPAKSEQRR